MYYLCHIFVQMECNNHRRKCFWICFHTEWTLNMVSVGSVIQSYVDVVPSNAIRVVLPNTALTDVVRKTWLGMEASNV